jgi:ABC-type nitrate/sulfonate/bicarbonate transport system substrate-binding protein
MVDQAREPKPGRSRKVFIKPRSPHLTARHSRRQSGLLADTGKRYREGNRRCVFERYCPHAHLPPCSSDRLRLSDKVSIMVGGCEKQIYLPAKLAESLGYFKDEGLDVELLNEASGVDAEDEMLAGAVQGVVGFYDHCVDLQAKGKFVESVVQFSQAPGEVELVSNKYQDVKSMADLKGKNLGVTGLGSSTNFLTQYLLTKTGVKLGEFTSVPVGAGDTFIAAMQQDKIQAGMTTEPTISRLITTGLARPLIDMRTIDKTKEALGGTYPAASLYMQTAWVENHKPLVQKLANAFVVAKGSFDAAGMYAAIVIIMVVALVADYIMTFIESRVAKWRPPALHDAN